MLRRYCDRRVLAQSCSLASATVATSYWAGSLLAVNNKTNF